MSWQEELRKLDEELASGKLSADDYRVRRDQVLSSAVAQGEDPNAGQPAQPGQPNAPEQPQSPEQAPPADGQAGGAGPNPDSTQVISPVNAPGHIDVNAERTQVVPPWEAQQAQQAQAPPYAPPGQPQYQQPGMASPAGGFQQPGPMSPSGGFQQPQQPQQPWNAPAPDQTPPWGGTDFPPIAPPTGPAWAGQGPEGGFDEPRKSGKGKIFAIIGVLVLLAGAGVGAWLLWGQGDDQNADPQQPPASESQPAPTSEAPEALRLGEIPGQQQAEHDDVQKFDDVLGKTYLNDTEIESYQRIDPGDARFSVFTQESGNTAVVMLVQAGDADAAADEVPNLAEIQTGNGAEDVSGDYADGVTVTEYRDEGGGVTQIRGHYVSDDVLVRVEVLGDFDKADAVRSDYANVLDAQLAEMPAES